MTGAENDNNIYDDDSFDSSVTSLPGSRASSQQDNKTYDSSEHVRISLPPSGSHGSKPPRPDSAGSQPIKVKIQKNGIRNGTLHLENGIDYTPLKRTQQSPATIKQRGKKEDPFGPQMDPLFRKYAELQEILRADKSNQGRTTGPQLDRYLARRAQELMVEYKLQQSKQPTFAWLSENVNGRKPPRKAKRSKFPRLPHNNRRDMMTSGAQTQSDWDLTLKPDNEYESAGKDIIHLCLLNQNRPQTLKKTLL